MHPAESPATQRYPTGARATARRRCGYRRQPPSHSQRSAPNPVKSQLVPPSSRRPPRCLHLACNSCQHQPSPVLTRQQTDGSHRDRPRPGDRRVSISRDRTLTTQQTGITAISVARSLLRTATTAAGGAGRSAAFFARVGARAEACPQAGQAIGSGTLAASSGDSPARLNLSSARPPGLAISMRIAVIRRGPASACALRKGSSGIRNSLALAGRSDQGHAEIRGCPACPSLTGAEVPQGMPGWHRKVAGDAQRTGSRCSR